MRKLTRYIVMQMAAPFLITTLTLASLIVLPFALKALSVVVINGQGFLTYLELLLYALMPSLTLAMPIAFFIALIYGLSMLDFQNEMTAMFSSGFSRTDIMRPVMLCALAVIILLMASAFFLRPWSENMRRISILQIRADIISTMLRVGSFTNPAHGITAFIRDHDDEGVIHGILLQDDRDPHQSVSYMAETGALLRSQNNAKLVMFNGVIQHQNKDRGITTVSFDKYSYDLSELAEPVHGSARNIRELYPQDLFFPPPETSEKDALLRQAAGHNYLALAIHILIYALLALDALCPVHGSQHSITGRIAILSSVVVAIELLAILLHQEAKSNPAFIFGIYLTPLALYAVSRLYMIINPFNLTSFTAGSIRPGRG